MKNMINGKIIITICLSLLLSASSFAEQTTTPPINLNSSSVNPNASSDETLSAAKSSVRLWNLQDADILSVINEVSQETGKNFIVDPRVNGKITLISNKPVRRGEVYQVFLSVLGLLGDSAIPSGNVVKIRSEEHTSELQS